MSEEYSKKINELLSLNYNKLETETMSKLSNSFTKFYMGITELYGKLKNKGLLKDDPYLNNNDVMEIELPESDPYTEQEASWKIPQRICKYISVLSYISHNYSLNINNIDFIDLDKIKKFIDFYIWADLLNPSATDINTAGLSKLVYSLRKGSSDQLVVSSIDKCIDTISLSHKNITQGLKYIHLYLKERYKQLIREEVIPALGNDSIDPKSILNEIIKRFDKSENNFKIYKKYINEVIEEEYGEEGEVLKNKNLKLLGYKKIDKIKEENVEDPFDTLTLALTEMGKVRIHLAQGIDKLNTNHNNLISKSGNFIQKLLRNISIFLFNIKQKTVYGINFVVNSKNKHVEIIFEDFFASVKRHEFILLELSEEYKIATFIETNRQDIENTMNKLISELKKDIKYMAALDEHFKKELKYKGLKSKGIKPELTVLKTIINSSVGQYREFLELIENSKA